MHKDKVYKGLHEGIIDEQIFDNVQKRLKENSVERKFENNNHSYALLGSKLFDDKGNYMSPSHSNNRYKKRYTYYISQAILQNRPQDVGSISKLPNGEIENVVRKIVIEFIKNKNEIQKYISKKTLEMQRKILKAVETLNFNDQIIRYVLKKVVVYQEKVEVVLNRNVLINVLEQLACNQDVIIDFEDTEFITLTKSTKLVAVPRRGNKLIIGDEVEYNLTLIQAITKGFFYHKLWSEGNLSKEQRSSYIYRLMNLRYLPPRLIEDVLNGKQAPGLTVKELYRIANESL